ncbi:MAG TPA: PAS domain-containing protein [Planctomycetota bacterium]|nr:PAS domain-containing protein [Planctomycetota bacterium]
MTIPASNECAVIATDLLGNITHWNGAAERLYGWKRDEVMGRNILAVTPAQTSSDDAASIMAQLVAGKSWSGKFTVQNRQGEVFQVHVTDTPLCDETGELVGVVGISRRIP